MNRRKNSDSIPMDLILEILSRLPAKSIRRFRFVSKLWDSILCRPYFNELFLTKSSSNPRLLILVEQGGDCFFFSTPQPQNPSSPVVAADFHMKFSVGTSPYNCCYPSGLIYFHNTRISKEDDYLTSVICNPSTEQCTILPPEPSLNCRTFRGFLGFDPIGKQYKVLAMKFNDHHHILTLGTEKRRWRNIQCPLSHYARKQNICINGVLYYLAQRYNESCDDVMVCFDVRSEKYKIIYLNSDCFRKWSIQLVNYKSKLGVINVEKDYYGESPHKLFMWILEDVEKQTWSTCVYTLKAENNVLNVNDNLSVVGATATGEIVLTKKNARKPFYVFYFNPQLNTLRSVEIQGVVRTEEKEWFNDHEVYVFVDHVENLQFDIMKTIYATSIRPPAQSTSNIT